MAATHTFFFGIVDRDFNDYRGDTFDITICLDSTVMLLIEQLKQECKLDDFHINVLRIFKNNLVLDTEVEDVADARIATIARIQEFKRNHDRLPEEIVEIDIGRNLAKYPWDSAPNLVHFFVQVPVRNNNKSDQFHTVLDDESIKEHEDLIIKVTEYQRWVIDDLFLNHIVVSSEGVPLVKAYEKMLDKPRIACADTTSQVEGDTASQVEGDTTSQVEGDTTSQVEEDTTSQVEGDDVVFYGPVVITDLEKHHVDELSIWSWQHLWHEFQPKFMDEIMAHTFFFFRLRRKINSFPSDCGITMQFGRSSWPFSLILMGPEGAEDRCRSLLPKSDVLIMSSLFPRLLVEVQSNDLEVGMPDDLVRMLVQAGFVVRFANGYLDTYKEKKDFVLVVIYMWKHGMAIRYIVYQMEDGTIAYKETKFDIKIPGERVKFAVQLYNFLDYLNHETEQAKKSTEQLERLRKAMADARRIMPALFSKPPSSKPTSKGTKRAREEGNDDDDDQGGRRSNSRQNNAQISAALREHGYEPHSKEDTRGPASRPNLKLYAHIFEVWAKDDPTRRTLIAKKIRRRSDELAILRSLNDSEPRSDRIITLIDSFDSPVGPWAILPRLSPVMDVVKRTFASYDLCWQLIEGVAFLHGRLIAHRDIKPENLVVDGERCLKIIDFDIAIQLTSEDAEVSGGQCGTDAWMAPEVYYERPSPYSPIQADRWSCGSVIEKFLKEGLRKKGKNIDVLKSISERLLSTKRKERPSLLEWKAWKEEEALKDVEGGSSGASSVQRMRPRPDETETRVAKKLKAMETEASSARMDVDACDST